MRVVNLILAFVFVVSLSQADTRESSQTSKNYRVIPPISNEEYKQWRKERNSFRTVEINRTVRLVTTYKNGKPCSSYITIVTYCDHYSDGTMRIWTRTF